jgi:hypothetical protein
MTDEEMAEEWWNNWAAKDWNDLQEGKRLFIQAFLDGLKAGRPKWHKVADGDLSEDNRLVLIQMVNGNTTMGIYYINAWREICYCKELTGVIAWCEIPKYTEVEK